ncbi:MAG: LLM class flavin-dependent oxidoreductase [Chloroflexi bacterium]|nr:LLM class flavin-dependent oxidoreductase [Chloroflexota bacterium]
MESSTNRHTERGIGLAAALPEEVALAAAEAAQDRGYHSFWLNNPPGANALVALGRAAQRATSIWLGVGVIPLSDQPADETVRRVRESLLPEDRFYLGIGSGAAGGGVERVAEGIEAVRAAALACPVVVAALGPRMCRLAGAQADGVLLNWLTPDFARAAIEWVREGADAAGRPMPRVMAYVRTALSDRAADRLRREAGNYEAIPQYAAHFKRMGVSAAATAVTGAAPEDVRRGLAAWDGVVDEVVVRAITASDTVEDVMPLLEAAAPIR